VKRAAKLTVIAGLALLTGCWDLFGLSPEVKLPISDLVVPETVSPAGPATVTVTVVTGGCRVFDRIVANRTASVVILTAWGEDGSGRGQMACPTDIRFEPKQYSIPGPFTDPLVISAVQPDGTSITRSVKVQ
jgi:hypothetical protein